MKQSDLDALIEELLKDPEFRKEWKKLCGADMRNITETPSSCTTTNPNSVEAYHQSLKGDAE